MRKLLCVATCVAVIVPAWAYAAGVDDQDDTAGRLDIKGCPHTGKTYCVDRAPGKQAD